MTFDFTINIPSLIGGIGALVTFIWFMSGLSNRLANTIEDVDKLAKAGDALHTMVLLHKEQFHEYQLKATTEYVTHAALAEIRRDLIAEIGRMEGRLEAQVDRVVKAKTQ